MSKSRLDSWKEIAEYLDKSPRTVQRWHAGHALPVHHLGGCKGSVFAYAEEIDRWLKSLGEDLRWVSSEQDDAADARRRKSFEFAAQAAEMWESRSEDNLQAIAGLYRKAIDQYPGNAAAFTGLANAMILAALEGGMDKSVAYPSAMEALRRTAQLDPGGPDSRLSSAWLQVVYERKWRQARKGFEEVLLVEPQNSFALAGLALSRIADGDLEGAHAAARNAWRQSLLVSSLGALVCWCGYLAGDSSSALELISQVKASGGQGVMQGAIEALAMIQEGVRPSTIERIEEIVRQNARSPLLQGLLGYAHALAGNREAAWESLCALEHLNPQKRRNHAYGLALNLLGLRRENDAIEWLEVSFAEGSLWSLGLASDPALRSLKGHPRFESLLRKIGATAVSQMHGAHRLVECAARAV